MSDIIENDPHPSGSSERKDEPPSENRGNNVYIANLNYRVLSK